MPYHVELRLPRCVASCVHPNNDVFDPTIAQHLLRAQKGLVLVPLQIGNKLEFAPGLCWLNLAR